jgi:hypothetical protein
MEATCLDNTFVNNPVPQPISKTCLLLSIPAYSEINAALRLARICPAGDDHLQISSAFAAILESCSNSRNSRLFMIFVDAILKLRSPSTRAVRMD